MKLRINSVLLINIFKNVLFFLLSATVLIVPFAIDNRFLIPTQYGQLFCLLEMTIAMILPLCLFLIYSKSIYLAKASLIDVLISIFITYISVSTFINYRTLEAIPFNYFQVIALYILYFSFRLINKNQSFYLFLCIIVCGGVEAVFGNLQLFGIFHSYNSFFKMTGSFFNPAPFAGFLIIILPLALGLCLNKKTIIGNEKIIKVTTIVALCACFTIILVIPSTDSRAAVYAGILSSAYIFLNNTRVKESIKSKVTKSAKLTVIIMTISLAILSFAFLYQKRSNSADGRILIWKASIPMIIHKPIIGYGFDKFKANYMDYQALYFSKNIGDEKNIQLSDNVDYAYNEPLHFVIEFGIIGCLLLAPIIFFSFKNRIIDEEYRTFVIASKGSIIALIIFSLFSYPFDIVPILIVLFFNLSIISRYTSMKDSHLRFSNSVGRHILNAIFTIPFIVFGVIASVVVYKTKKGYILWNIANYYYQSQDYSKSLKYYSEADPLMNNNGLFLNHYGKALSLTANAQLSNEILKKSLIYLSNSYTYLAIGDNYKKLGNYDSAEISYKKAFLMVPSHLYPKFCLAALYEQIGQEENARRTAKELLDMKIKVSSPAVNEMRENMQQLIIKIDNKHR